MRDPLRSNADPYGIPKSSSFEIAIDSWGFICERAACAAINVRSRKIAPRSEGRESRKTVCLYYGILNCVTTASFQAGSCRFDPGLLLLDLKAYSSSRYPVPNDLQQRFSWTSASKPSKCKGVTRVFSTPTPVHWESSVDRCGGIGQVTGSAEKRPALI
jgi:hypothetical protein